MSDAFRVTRDGREICSKAPKGRDEYRRRTIAMGHRQRWLCALCGLHMSRETLSFDHEHGRGMGGAKRDDRIEVGGRWQNAAVHILCNGEKGSRKVPYVIMQDNA